MIEQIVTNTSPLFMSILMLKGTLQIATNAAYHAIISVPEIRSATYVYSSPMQSFIINNLVRTIEVSRAYRIKTLEDLDLIAGRKELIKEFADIPELAIFDEMVRLFGMNWEMLHFDGLADSLIQRSLEVGVDRSIAELQQYINADDFGYEQMIFIGGIEVEHPQQLAQGISLIPFSPSEPKDRAHVPSVSNLWGGISYPPSQITAALIRQGRHPKRHELIENTKDNQFSIKSVEDLNQLEDALLCVTLVGPSGPARIATSVGLTDEVPFSFGGRHGQVPSRVEVGYPNVKLNADLLERLAHIHTNFCALKEPERKKILVPLTRLNLAMRSNWDVYSAINLGIALENLFTDEKPFDSSISFTLRVRAARLLRDNLKDRKELADFISTLYRLRSKAAHDGELLEKIGGSSSSDILTRGAKEVATAIEYFITNGKPNWEDIVFS